MAAQQLSYVSSQSVHSKRFLKKGVLVGHEFVSQIPWWFVRYKEGGDLPIQEFQPRDDFHGVFTVQSSFCHHEVDWPLVIMAGTNHLILATRLQDRIAKGA